MLAGALTLQQLQSVLDVKTFSRLKELLDGLAIIGLLAPTLVSTDGGGQSGGLKEARWAAEGQALLEQPAEEQGRRHQSPGSELVHLPGFVSNNSSSQCGGLKEARWAARATLCSKSLRRHKVGRGVQTQERANSRRDATQLIRSICPCDCMLPFLHA